MESYEQIRDWVKDNRGFVPKTCWIAHVKEICGLDLRKADNRQGATRTNPCPGDKVEAIKDAFSYFGMI